MSRECTRHTINKQLVCYQSLQLGVIEQIIK